MKTWPLAALMAVIASIILSAPPAAAQPAADGPIAALQAWQARKPDHRVRAVIVARRLVRIAVPDDARQAEALETVFGADRRFGEDLREAVDGAVVRPSWRHRRWMRGALASRDPHVRELMRRAFADQLQPEQGDTIVLQPAIDALIAQRRAALNRANARWLKGVLGRIGWFRIRRYGPEALQAAWLIVQHADFDPAWQRRVAATLRPMVDSGDMQASYYGYLTDRIAANAHMAQTYGTQGHCVDGDWQPLAMIDPARLDERRRAIGLPPMAEYRAMFRCD